MTRRLEENDGCCSSLQRKGGLHALWELGKGGQGFVFLCTDQTRRVRFACKTIRSHAQPQHSLSIQNQIGQIVEGCPKKRKLNAADHDVRGHGRLLSASSKSKLSAEEVYEDTQLRWEAEVLQRLNGISGVLPLVSTFEGDDTCFHLVTAFCDAGDLLGKLDAHPPLFKLPHREAAPIVVSLARTLASCHTRGIVHRDIKPGNILFRRMAGNEHREEVVIADFGLAATITPGSGEMLCDRVGTSRYQAPEVIRGQYDHRADIWSLGIIIHLLLTSTLPFNIECLSRGAPDSAIQQAILCNELKLEGLDLPSSAQDLLRRILCKDPSARLTLEEVLCHPWLLHNSTEPIIGHVAQKQTNLRAATIAASLTGSAPSSPNSQHGARQRVSGFDEADHSIPKLKRARRPMGKHFFRQQWGNAVTKAAVAN